MKIYTQETNNYIEPSIRKTSYGLINLLGRLIKDDPCVVNLKSSPTIQAYSLMYRVWVAIILLIL
jgi:hypothetical protein